MRHVCARVFFLFFLPLALSPDHMWTSSVSLCACLYFSFTRPQIHIFMRLVLRLKLLQTSALTFVCMAHEKRQSFWLCWRLWNPSLRCQLDMKRSLLFIIHIISKTSHTFFPFLRSFLLCVILPRRTRSHSHFNLFRFCKPFKMIDIPKDNGFHAK